MEKIGIELEEAEEIIVQNILPLEAVEEIGLWEANGRIAAGAVYSGVDNPPFARSPLDGYAFRSRDVAQAGRPSPAKLRVTGVVYAGGWYEGEIGCGQAVRIMTGAPIPAGADCVIRQEDVELSEDSGYVYIPRSMERYENYCFQGEDLKKGDQLLEKDSPIGWVEQGILASAGVGQVQVYRKPRIALYVTGDELCLPGKGLPLGKIYDSNYWLLSGRMRELGYPPVTAEILPDDPEIVARKIKSVINQVDLVITTGGVSVGEKDIFHQVLPMVGAERLFWRVRMKPGTPAMFALCHGVPMLHLSGNPFAAAATFELLAVPALERLSRDRKLRRKKTWAVLDTDFHKSGGRRFLRGHLENGRVTLPSTEKHASGMLFSMQGCNCLVDLLPSGTPFLAGRQVEVIML